MTLRTVAIPDPAPGVDWSTVVPGNWLYDVTGITASLAVGASVVTTCVDSSGNGRDGTYDPVAPVLQTSLLPAGGGTDCSFRRGLLGPTGHQHVNLPNDTPDWTAPWTVEFWIKTDETAGEVLLFFSSMDFTQLDVFITDSAGGDQCIDVFDSGFATDWVSNNVVLDDNLPHYCVVVFDGATVTFYVDGVDIGVDVGSGTFEVVTADTNVIGSTDGVNNALAASLDQLAIYESALSAGTVSAHYAAAASSYAAYHAAVLAATPFSFYQFDETATGGPRQVTLVVATSTGVVADICTGFPLASGAGPYAYSWQPHIASNSQTPDGSTTTVAIPRLILPAGYSLGSDTLDIGVADQWSDITLWWDDTFMLSLADVNPYVYPPGVKLVYRPQGAT